MTVMTREKTKAEIDQLLKHYRQKLEREKINAVDTRETRHYIAKLEEMQKVATGQWYDGKTYVPVRDGERLAKQTQKIWEIMRDGNWHTIHDLAAACGCAETSASARLRDLRKERFGSHTVERKHFMGGVHMYRLVPNLNPSGV